MVGEEGKTGEDETMKCQPIPTHSPAAAMINVWEVLLPTPWHAQHQHGVEWVCAAPGEWERGWKEGEKGSRERKREPGHLKIRCCVVQGENAPPWDEALAGMQELTGRFI